MLIEPLLLEDQSDVCLRSNLMLKAMTARSSPRFERIFLRGHPKGFAIETGEVVVICIGSHVCLTFILIIVLNRYAITDFG